MNKEKLKAGIVLFLVFVVVALVLLVCAAYHINLLELLLFRP